MNTIGHPLIASLLLLQSLFGSRSFSAATITSILLTACAGPIVENVSQVPPATADVTLPLPVEGEQLDLKAIERVVRLAKEESLLVARYERNQLLLSNIDASTLLVIDSQLAWFSGDSAVSNQLLIQLERDNTAATDFVLREREARSVITGDWLEAANFLFQRLRGGVANDQDQAVSDLLFSYLLRLDNTILAREILKAEDRNWRQWLEMQIVYRQGLKALSAWLARPEKIPQYPPIPIHLKRWAESAGFDNITLLLPLEGQLASAGRAVLSGAMDQLYTLFPDPSRRPTLTILNSTQTASIGNLYHQAADGGADLIIGPLTKQAVGMLGQLTRRPVPIIALNQTEELTDSPYNSWVSISLAPEDEAHQIADVAFGQSCRNAIVIGTDNDRGVRLLSSFTQRWNYLGGKLRGQVLVGDAADTNRKMGKLLGSGSSDQRISAIERAFDLPVDARGRGRSDFECIFMLAPDPPTARRWRPLLFFHMTGDTPVYATSVINDGEDDTRNRDLNGVVFVEIPAMLKKEATDRLSRLKALGSDAMNLAMHWDQITATEQWVIRGQTGLLRRREDGSVERALELATFNGSQIRRKPLR